jgi:polyhydroxyalkanoate synthesis regulator phasin
MADAWRAYLEMALGLTEAPRKRAQKVVGDLANRGGATAAQLQGLVDDLTSAGMANREALTNIVRHEVDRALGVVGLATVQEVDELNARVRDLERQLRDAKDRLVADDESGQPGTGGTRLDEPAPLPRKVAAKKVAKKATPNAMPSAATTAAPAKSATAAAPAESATAAPAKKAAAKTTGKTVTKSAFLGPAKKAAKKAVAKKAPGTAEAPTAGVREAAAETVLPPAKKAAAKKAPAKKAEPGRPEETA